MPEVRTEQLMLPFASDDQRLRLRFIQMRALPKLVFTALESESGSLGGACLSAMKVRPLLPSIPMSLRSKKYGHDLRVKEDTLYKTFKKVIYFSLMAAFAAWVLQRYL